MKKVEDYEKVRRAYFINKLSIREIHRQMGYSREFVRKAIAQPAPQPYRLRHARAAPVIGPYQQRISVLMDESDQQPRKQRYTAHRIYEILKSEGYSGSEGAVHNYVCRQRKKRKRRESYLPLEFDPGMDAQVDWGEAEAEIGGQRVKVQLFILRLNYSRVRFVRAYPFQKQEAFLEGHIQAFHFLGGVPHRIAYDNLKTAVYKVLTGHKRQEQDAFTAFRSQYLFESFYCNVGQGHEKGGVENDVGYVQRNFMAPILQAETFAQLNELLLSRCQENVQRHIRGQGTTTVAELWQVEREYMLPLPTTDYPACTTHLVQPNGYSLVPFETNRYSVPVTHRDSRLVLEAYPFRVRILSDQAEIACHERCFDHEQDILEPLHYLSLLEQRPAAFEHAVPVRRWRKKWPATYELLLQELRQRWPDGRGVREFVAILKLHQNYPAHQVEQAVCKALELEMAHFNGVRACLEQITQPASIAKPLDLRDHPDLVGIGSQPLNLSQYDQLLVR